MELDPQVPTYQTSDSTSFGHETVVSRWPSILTGAVDDLHRTISSLPDSSDSAKVAEGKALVSDLATLKYEVQHNRKLKPLADDGSPDIASYNAELEQRGTPNWHDVQWLYAECYVYRRIATLFKLSEHWKAYDVFGRQKLSTFKSSRPAVLELAAKYKDIICQIRESDAVVDVSDPQKIAEAEEVLFNEMAEICLWGNATDLSLLTNLTYEDIQKLQRSQSRKDSQEHVIVNDMGKAFAVLNQAKTEKKEHRRVDIVLDNAGFELFVDLVLAGYLIATGLATEVVMHPKDIPWFVSDVMPKDFAGLLEAMADPRAFYERTDDDTTPEKLSVEEVANIRFLFEHWSQLHGEGQLILRPNVFWTHAGSFWRMPKVAKSLFEDLQESELVIFKGDLNYRKLTGDGAWEASTPFTTAIGPLAKSGIRTLALRTCKADVVVGLPAGKDEELRRTPSGEVEVARKWAWSGKWAVVQFCDGKA